MNNRKRILANMMMVVAVAFSIDTPLAFAGKSSRPPPPPPPPPTEPAARYWHGFVDNGSIAPDASRLYMFGGAGTDYLPTSDLWYYRVSDAKWTLAPTSSSQPGGRQHMGFSCGAGRCVVANGVGSTTYEDTWIYTEESKVWTQVNCKRYLCPSARYMPTMAYDTARNYHVLFGGLVAMMTNLGDTFTFSNTTQRWTRHDPPDSPAARRSAAAAFVTGPLNRVVMLGGQIEFVDVLCDMWSWTGSNWEEVEQLNWFEGPCLHSHSMAWDGERLVVTGGYVDYNDTPNNGVWTFAFTADGTAGEWSHYADWTTYFACTGAGVIHPGARMAWDPPSGTMVSFGGVENVKGQGAVPYADLTICN